MDEPRVPVDLDDLDPATYLRIKRIASRFVRSGLNPSLTTTVVAHEIWIRLKRSRSRLPLDDDEHFDALVGQTAGFVRTDSIRKRFAAKRDSGGLVEVDLDRQAARQTSLDTILQIHSALEALAVKYPKSADVLRDFYFEGLTVAEICPKREMTRRAVERALTWGRAWIQDWLTSNGPRTDGAAPAPPK